MKKGLCCSQSTPPGIAVKPATASDDDQDICKEDQGVETQLEEVKTIEPPPTGFVALVFSMAGVADFAARKQLRDAFRPWNEGKQSTTTYESVFSLIVPTKSSVDFSG